MTEQTNSNSDAMQQAEATALAQYLARGEHVKLRGVQEPDLERLAAIMSQAPLVGVKPRPWTTQSLRKQFEDEKDPGLWGRQERTYCAVDAAGAVIGYIQARQRDRNIEFYCHVDQHNPDRDMLGRDLVAAYLRLLTDWNDPARVEASILEVETAKAAWLTASGFELEVEIKQSYMFEGQPVACQIWGWVNPQVLNG